MDRWYVRLTEAADLDIDGIVATSIRLFGPRQARAYENLLASAVEDLRSGPDVLGSVVRLDVLGDLRTLRIARRGHRASHYLVYRVVGHRRIDVIRVLHDRMHLPHLIPQDRG